jgi:hypothetical protein
MTMPTQADYDEMLATLRHATTEMSAAPDDIEGRAYKRHLVLRGLEAVIHYLLADPRVRNGTLTAPLAYARAAIHDAGLGARPALLDSHFPEGSSTRPAGVSREYAQGYLAFAAHLLIPAMGKTQGLAWLATEVRQAGLRTETGAPITSERLYRWRTEISRGKGPPTARQEFERLRQRYHALCNAPKSDLKGNRVRTSVRAIIKTISTTLGPVSAPPAMAR